MQKDIRGTHIYQTIEALCNALRRPGGGQISDVAEIHVAPDGQRTVFTATLVDTLQGPLPTRICSIDLATGDTRVITFGPNLDRLAKFAPNGRQIAFLSDRHAAGNFQLYLLDPASGAARAAAPVVGWIEYLHWSPDGTRILLGVAGHGADVAGAHGAVTSRQIAEELPSWMPSVESGEESYRWRSVWVYEMATGSVRQVSPAGCNAWEAVWCGNGDIAAVVSPGASEGQWYTARLHILALESGNSREIFVPRDQIGCPAANPSGTQLAVVEAICSDRWIVAGELRLIEPRSAKVRPVHTADVDITSAEWRDERHLLLTGHRGPESVIGLLDAVSNVFEEIWASEEITSGGRYFTVSGCNDTGDCVFAAESFKRAPEIAIVRGGKYAAIKSFDLGYAVHASDINSVESVSWWAPDGLEIQGWLLRPRGAAPYPMVMSVHGGPVWHARPRWLGRTGLDTLMLLKLGYAVFFPNVRGSAGRGQEFARHVLGDMGGADTHDFLSGLDFLVSARIADPRRLGVTGGSYGGFITSWLITQDARFAAAVPAAPITNWVTEHLISNAPAWPALFLGDRYTNPDGKYFQRSPIMHAHKVKTPTLTICGALDRTTPPAEAVQFHNALLENGVKSVLVTYPQGGHGVPGFPAAIDYAARIVTWFEEHMPPDGEERTTSTAP